MKTILLSLAMIVGMGLLVVGANAFNSSERSGCPGKITCPLTGEEVCKDRCPLRDPNRSDCPGKIECPLTGELVCRDKCPLGSATAGDSDETPSCCRAAK